MSYKMFDFFLFLFLLFVVQLVSKLDLYFYLYINEDLLNESKIQLLYFKNSIKTYVLEFITIFHLKRPSTPFTKPSCVA